MRAGDKNVFGQQPESLSSGLTVFLVLQELPVCRDLPTVTREEVQQLTDML